MNIHITKEAAAWYKEEYEVDTASFRFFARYGGFGGNIPGFSVGIRLEEPLHIHTSTKVCDMLFFIDESDAWYFEGKDVEIILDTERAEPLFIYQ